MNFLSETISEKPWNAAEQTGESCVVSVKFTDFME